MKKFFTRYVLYGALLLILCLGIFPFVILHSTSMTIAELLDRFSREKKFAEKLDRFWTAIGKPYDVLAKTVSG